MLSANEVFVLALVSAVLAWAPAGLHLVRGRQLSRKLKVALLAFTLGPITLIMLGLWIRFPFGYFPEWDMREFDAAGVPACVLAIVLAIADAKASKFLALGVIMGSLLDLVILAYLSMLH